MNSLVLRRIKALEDSEAATADELRRVKEIMIRIVWATMGGTWAASPTWERILSDLQKEEVENDRTRDN